MLRFSVTNKLGRQHFEHMGGPIEFGRGPERARVPRCVIQDGYVSRDHLLVEEQESGRVRVGNLSLRNPVRVGDGTVIDTQAAREFLLPVRLTVGETVIEIEGPLAAAEAPACASLVPLEDLVVRARVTADADAADFQGPAAGQHLHAVLRVGQQLAGILDLDRLLDKLLSPVVLMPYFPKAERGSVVLRRGDDLATRVECDWLPWRYRPSGTSPSSEAIIRLALREGVGVLAGPASAVKGGSDAVAGTLLCAPLIGQDGLRLGAVVLEARRDEEAFRVEDLHLLTAIALQVAVLVQNVARHTELVGGAEDIPPSPPAASPAFSSHAVVTCYPAPVALAYRRFCRQQDPTARLQALFAALEATIRYLVTVGVSDLLRGLATSGSPGARLPEHPAFDFLRRPRPMTIGDWISALREPARALAAGPPGVVPELGVVCAPGGPLVDGALSRLVALRNAHVHQEGNLVPTPEECKEGLREARPLLDEVLQQIRFVCDYPLGFAQRSRGGAAPERRRYYVHACMGARVANTVEASAVDFPFALKEDVPFLVTRDGSRLLYLWPLLLQRVAVHTERHTLYVFEDIPDRHGAFLTRVRSAAIDARDSWTQALREQPAADHGWLLEWLRELPAVVDIPPGLRLAERMAPLSGGKLVEKLLGPNRLLSVVAVGGFSTVYAAEETGTGRRVAVKVMESPEAQRHLARFRQEFERLREAASHPTIVRCFDWGDPIIGGREYPWFSMEFATGGDLSGRIDERRAEHPEGAPWTEPALRAEIVREFRAVTGAVAHLHSLGIVHRDIKPGNVLIMEDGELRLSDLGLVKDLNVRDEMALAQTILLPPRTSTGAVLGTRHYMAPEQERGEDTGTAADVYSLGILLAELALGERPRATTEISTGSTLQSWSKLGQLPAELKRLILQLTAVDPARRPPDARAVQMAFDATVQVGDLSSPPALRG